MATYLKTTETTQTPGGRALLSATSVTVGKPVVLRTVWDFKAAGTFDTGINIPAGALIMGAFLSVQTLFAGASSALALQTHGASANLISASAGALANIDGDDDVIGGMSLAIKVKTATHLDVTISGGSGQTAGKAEILVIYVPCDPS